MHVRVNGEDHTVEQRITVRELLARLGLGDTLVAVERNRAVVPRAEHAVSTLNDGDEIEIVHFVGGG